LEGQGKQEVESQPQSQAGVEEEALSDEAVPDITPPLEDYPDLIECLANIIPLPLHSGLLRLAVAGTVSRAGMLNKGGPQSGLPGLILLGPPGVGKTGLARVVMRLFGLGERVFKYLPRAAVGEITLRRHQVAGAYAASESWLWELPLAILDELSDAEMPVRKAAMDYFQGEAKLTVEGEVLTVKPFPISTFNPARGKLVVPERIERRAIIADLTGVWEKRAEIEKSLSWALDPKTELPLLDLEALSAKVDTAKRPEDEEFLRKLYRAGLVEAKDKLVLDLLPIWHLWQGYRAAFDLEAAAAALACVHDGLLVLSTRGLTRRDWLPRLMMAYRGLDYSPPAESKAEALPQVEVLSPSRPEAAVDRLLDIEKERAGLEVLVEQLEGEIEALPKQALDFLAKELAQRGIKGSARRYKATVEKGIHAELARAPWFVDLIALKRMARRQLPLDLVRACAERLRECQTELEKFKQALWQHLRHQAENLASLAFRRQVPGLKPALTPARKSAYPTSREARELVERLEQYQRALLQPRDYTEAELRAAGYADWQIDLILGRRRGEE
jgi:hypothetical protein